MYHNGNRQQQHAGTPAAGGGGASGGPRPARPTTEVARERLVAELLVRERAIKALDAGDADALQRAHRELVERSADRHTTDLVLSHAIDELVHGGHRA